ncbi:response regulator [Spongisporangium articulatum]|uniref:Response regulator n=1 Tax=Spongisporangium articulatum TaxID=3362603 RepID=A0ABW8ATL7_9ACTN
MPDRFPRPEVILLVEDNPDDVALTVRAFRKNNFVNEIVVARDGAEARDLLLPTDGREALRPLIALVDLNMPRVGGLELIRSLRADPRTELLPVIVLTTSSEERDIAESYRLGANSFVRKPVTFGEFLTAANVLGMYWLMVNEPPGAAVEVDRPEPADRASRT